MYKSRWRDELGRLHLRWFSLVARVSGKSRKKNPYQSKHGDPLSNFWWIKKLERNINGFFVWIRFFFMRLRFIRYVWGSDGAADDASFDKSGRSTTPHGPFSASLQSANKFHFSLCALSWHKLLRIYRENRYCVCTFHRANELWTGFFVARRLMRFFLIKAMND